MGELETALDTGLKERITSLTQLERLRVAGEAHNSSNSKGDWKPLFQMGFGQQPIMELACLD